MPDTDRHATPPGPDYLGDGVYVSHDGFQLWLGLQARQQMIALEPEVFKALVRYAERMKAAGWAI
jgi:hypothetical protein